MKKQRDESTEPKTKKSKLEQAREAWGATDDDYDTSKEQYWKPKDGKNTIRVLPNKDPEELWYVAFAMHFNLGPDGKGRFRCTEKGGPFGHNKQLDKKRNYKASTCVACRIYTRNKTKSMAFEFGSKEGKRFWTEKVAPWRAKHQYVFAINQPKSGSEKDKVKVYTSGVMIGKPLIDLYLGEGRVDFVHPVTGMNVMIVKKMLGGGDNNVDYKTTVIPTVVKIPNWKTLRKQLPDLASFVPESLDAAAQKLVIEGEAEGDDDDDLPKERGTSKKSKGRSHEDDDDDEDLDDDEDEGTERHHKLAKRERDADEDVDPDADEEDDDDEDEPAPKKKKKSKQATSKMRDKLKKKAKRDDEDEDDDDDEDSDSEDDDSDDEEEDADLDDEDEDEDEE